MISISADFNQRKQASYNISFSQFDKSTISSYDAQICPSHRIDHHGNLRTKRKKNVNNSTKNHCINYTSNKFLIFMLIPLQGNFCSAEAPYRWSIAVPSRGNEAKLATTLERTGGICTRSSTHRYGKPLAQ